MEKNEMIFGIRAVIEAVEAGKEIDKILIKKDLQGDLAKRTFRFDKRSWIFRPACTGRTIEPDYPQNHQGVIAFISAVSYQRLGDIIPSLFEEGKVPFIVLLDGITDVRNFGAIARTCECTGVDAIVLPERGSVSVNADAVKTSAGALLHIPVCRERSIHSAIRYLKDSGIKVVAASEKSVTNYTRVDYTVPVAVVMGAEDTGVDADNLRLCDEMVAIPQVGNIGSLNVSVAAGVMMYEVVRQRFSGDSVF